MSAPSKRKTDSNRQATGKSKPGKSRLPLILVGGGVILLLLASIFIYNSNKPQKSEAPLEVNGAPALKLDKERIDFGDVKVNTPVTATFELANVGDQPLRFSEVPKVEVVEGC
jgi:hypothetical protein